MTKKADGGSERRFLGGFVRRNLKILPKNRKIETKRLFFRISTDKTP